jgi:translation elongation factor EF-Tu-like GTPase
LDNASSLERTALVKYGRQPPTDNPPDSPSFPKQVGVPSLVVFLNMVDAVEDEQLVDLVVAGVWTIVCIIIDSATN